MTLIVQFYRSTWLGEWRWRLRDGYNKRIVGASSEGYRTRKVMLKNFYRVTGISSLPVTFKHGQASYTFRIFR